MTPSGGRGPVTTFLVCWTIEIPHREQKSESGLLKCPREQITPGTMGTSAAGKWAGGALGGSVEISTPAQRTTAAPPCTTPWPNSYRSVSSGSGSATASQTAATGSFTTWSTKDAASRLLTVC